MCVDVCVCVPAMLNNACVCRLLRAFHAELCVLCGSCAGAISVGTLARYKGLMHLPDVSKGGLKPGVALRQGMLRVECHCHEW